MNAGRIIKDNFNKNYSVAYKENNCNNIVTDIDKMAEESIVNTIKSNFSDHNILSEETIYPKTNSRYRWIIDPLDGTLNFLRKIPICAVSIALEHNNVITHGVTYNPFLQEYFYAEKNKGAFLNDKKIQVSNRKKSEELVIGTSFPNKSKNADLEPHNVYLKFAEQGCSIRRTGSATTNFAWVACGRLDGFYSFALKPWDYLVGTLLVEEAGGTITDFKNEKIEFSANQILASNSFLHQSILKTINK